MRITVLGKERPVWQAVLAIVLLSVVGYMHFTLYYYRECMLLAGAAMLVMFARGDIRRLWNLPSVLLLGYVGYTTVSVFWAVAGKFFLNQLSKLVPAAAIFMALVLYGCIEKSFVRRVLAVSADVSALLALLSVEAASTGLVRSAAYRFLNAGDLTMKFTSARLFGLFGNSNVEASVYAIGVLLSLALLIEAESRRERILRAVTAVASAFAFLLSFSMGAMACFAVAVVAYLIAAGAARGAVLARMLAVAVPTVPLAFLSSRFFNASGAFVIFPLLLLFLAAAAAAILELRVSDRLAAALGAREKLLYGVVLGVVALGVVYAALAMRLGAPYTFGASLYRSISLAPGEHTLQIDADGSVAVSITSKNELQVLTDGLDKLYSVDAAAASFTVPAGSESVTFTFTAEPGTTLRAAAVDGATPILLRYRLLPSFAANRLQGTLTSNSSVAVRRMLWRDGLRYWKLSPVFGHGLGSFETGITRVQDFDYETKYPHNHYIQVLLEGGVVGFALFLGALLALAGALSKRRRAMREGQFAVLYAAFVAEFVMNALQMLWDIQMSNLFFLCQIFSLYALIVLTCAEPLGKRKSEALPEEAADAKAAAAQGGGKAAKAPKKKKRAAAKSPVRAEIRLACVLIPTFLALTALGNIVARPLVTKPPTDSLAHYLANLELASGIDLYEHNDARLNYCLQVAQYEGTEEFRPQADAYAEQLSQLESNSIHMYLIEYYINTQQYEKAVDMALLSAFYAASDESVWNDNIDLLKQALLDPGIFSPLLYDDSGALLPKLLQYRDAWLRRGETAPVPIALTPEHEAFFDAIAALDACGGNVAEMAKLLSAR